MRRLLIAIVLMSGVAGAPVLAQNGVIDLRVGKLEKEMKAVQRKVFPNGVALEPEISGVASAGAAGTAASAPITDLTARVDALEAQLKSLTGQVEQNGFRLKKAEEGMKSIEGRLKALEPQPVITSGTDDGPPVSSDIMPKAPAASKPVAVAAAKPAAVAAKPAVPLAKPTAVKPPPVTATKVDPARKAAIAAVEVPDSGDAAEDSYAYGFRLWQAKLYPEAQAKLKEFVSKYPSHRKLSFAQNLLGRAYLDEGKPALASVAFYDNYQKNPRGDRAAESLSWLGTALLRLKKPADACKVYTEFDEVYGAKAAADLKARVSKGRADAKCAA
jgi:TolA-binding protein